MNNIVSSIATVNANGMQRLAVTYSVVDESGKIVENNKKENRVVLDEEALKHIKALMDFAQVIIDEG